VDTQTHTDHIFSTLLSYPALDGLEYISLGIVKDILKMKVLSTEQFSQLETDLEEAKGAANSTKAQLDEYIKTSGVKTSELLTMVSESAVKSNSLQVTATNLEKEKAQLQAAVQAAAAEADTLRNKIFTLEKEKAELKELAVPATPAAPAAAVAAPAVPAAPVAPAAAAAVASNNDRRLRGR